MNTVSPEKATPRPMDAGALEALAERAYREGYADGEVAREFGSHDPDNEWRTSDTRAYLAALPAPAGAVEARPTGDALEVTDAEIKAFRDKYREMWPGSWPDRESTIELLTASKRAVAVARDAFRSTLAASAPASPAIGVQAVTDEMVKRTVPTYVEVLKLRGTTSEHDVRLILQAALHLAPEAASPTAAVEMDGHDPRIAELQEIQDGAWGDDPMVRGAARDLIASRDTPSDTAPSPKVSDGVREAARRAVDAFRTYAIALRGPFATRYDTANDLDIQAKLLEAALSQEHAPGLESQ